LSNCPAQAEPPRAGCPGPSPGGFWISPRMKTPQPPRATCAKRSVNPHNEKVFPDLQREPPVFQFLPIGTGPVIGHHWKESGSIVFAPSLQTFIYVDNSPSKPCLLEAEQSQLSQHFLVVEMFQSLNSCHGPSLDSLQFICLSCIGEPRTGHSTPGVTSPVLCRGEGSSPSVLLALLCLMQPNNILAFFCCKDILLAHIQLGVHQTPSSFSAKLHSSWVAPSIYWHRGLFTSRFYMSQQRAPPAKKANSILG